MLTEEDVDGVKTKLAQVYELRLKVDGALSRCPLCTAMVDLGRGFAVALINGETLAGYLCPTCSDREAGYLASAVHSINQKFRQAQAELQKILDGHERAKAAEWRQRLADAEAKGLLKEPMPFGPPPAPKEPFMAAIQKKDRRIMELEGRVRQLEAQVVAPAKR